MEARDIIFVIIGDAGGVYREETVIDFTRPIFNPVRGGFSRALISALYRLETKLETVLRPPGLVSVKGGSFLGPAV